MSDTETLARFETALERSVAEGADPDEIAAALDQIDRRVQALRIARGEGVDDV